MGTEIERKFLVKGDGWRGRAAGISYRQGYLSLGPIGTVRVRIGGDQARLSIKGPSRGAARAEYEYPIPLADAEEMLATLCVQPIISKTRYRIEHEGFVWEVDEFAAENAGLVLAEIELQDEAEAFPLPDWVGEEVTSDPRYFNSYLTQHPYTRW